MDSAVFISQDVFSIKGRGTVLTGVLKEGMLRKGMKANINGKEAEVAGIEGFRKSFDEGISSSDEAAQKGIGVLLKNIEKEDVDPLIQSQIPIQFT